MSTGSAQAQMDRTFWRWRDDPSAFVREAFGAIPDPWQEEVLQQYGMAVQGEDARAAICRDHRLEPWMLPPPLEMELLRFDAELVAAH